MSAPTTTSLDIPALRDAFVRPLYLRLLHGNFTHLSEADGDGFRRAAAKAASAISDEQIRRLLTEREWRGRLCAAWFIGLRHRASFIRLIAEMLLASEFCYAGQGYCAALGLIGSDESAGFLRSYLETYLPLRGRIYDQDWAIGALTHLEGVANDHTGGDATVDPLVNETVGLLHSSANLNSPVPVAITTVTALSNTMGPFKTIISFNRY
jgi:hypothetical protein